MHGCTTQGQPVYRKGGWYGTIGNPHRARIYQFELFELILSLTFHLTTHTCRVNTGRVKEYYFVRRVLRQDICTIRQHICNICQHICTIRQTIAPCCPCIKLHATSVNIKYFCCAHAYSAHVSVEATMRQTDRLTAVWKPLTPTRSCRVVRLYNTTTTNNNNNDNNDNADN